MEEQEKQELMKRAETFAATQSVDKAMAEVGIDSKETQEGLKQEFNKEKTPDKQEQKQIKNKVRNILSGYRYNKLEEIDVANYRKFCELAEIRAESDKKLDKIKREKEWDEIQYWLKKNKGNLEEIKYNTESKPNVFWYGLNRGIWYMRKTFSNIPRLTWYILAGACGIGLMILMAFGIAKIV